MVKGHNRTVHFRLPYPGGGSLLACCRTACSWLELGPEVLLVSQQVFSGELEPLPSLCQDLGAARMSFVDKDTFCPFCPSPG